MTADQKGPVMTGTTGDCRYLVNVNVRLNQGDDNGAWAAVVVPVMTPWPDDQDIDEFYEVAKAAALDSLRPFLNNRAHFDADIWMPMEPVQAAPSTTGDRS